MNVLHLNTRATQGGAAKVASMLHQECLNQEIESTYLYGYGSGIKDDPDADESYKRLGTKLGVLGNYIVHSIVGRDIFVPGKRRLFRAIRDADIIQIHNLHHHYIKFEYVFGIIRRLDKPVCVTAHDEWWLTGRCAWTRSCVGWKAACGVCQMQRQEELSSVYDFSRQQKAKKDRFLASYPRLRIVAPSKWLYDRFAAKSYPAKYIPNAVHPIFFETSPVISLKAENLRIAVCVNDFRQPGKVDISLLEELSREKGITLVLIGKNPPPGLGEQVGYVSSTAILKSVYSRCHAFLFSSTVDNAPLVLIEAAASGLRIFALKTDASQEILRPLAIETFNRSLMISRIRHYRDYCSWDEHYDQRERAKQNYSVNAMFGRYRAVWDELIRDD